MVFNKLFETSFLVTFLSFINDLSFIIFNSLVKKIVKALRKIAKKIIEWEKLNTIIYDTSKIKIVLFLQSCWQQPNK